MGYYIEVNALHNKAQMIADGKALGVDSSLAQGTMSYEAEIIAQPASFADVPEDKALICVVDNGMFEAAGYVFSEGEFKAFTHPDGRPRTWVLMDKEAAEAASGYRQAA